MEPTVTILLSIFLVLAITMFVLLFGNPSDVFSSNVYVPTTTTSVTPTSASKETKEHHRMPDPPEHITRGFQRAPSLNTPYPKNLPPLGFEHVTALPESSQSNICGPLPYPQGIIEQMPQPFDNRAPIVPNEWSYIEEQIIREVASNPNPDVHPPSYEEALSLD
ncbi:hypothetical protein FQR65_LT03031 [Abscondita terminalis]|nr:hypothetical protein FQR65_LT03031 [Abscondita terminalis]